MRCPIHGGGGGGGDKLILHGLQLHGFHGVQQEKQTLDKSLSSTSTPGWTSSRRRVRLHR
jgi:hypothetical protein